MVGEVWEPWRLASDSAIGGLPLAHNKNKSIGIKRKLNRKLQSVSTDLTDKWRKFRWRIKNGRAAETIPVFIIGAQRSGTTMLGNCLGRSPEIENLGESDRRAFHRYSLLDDSTVRDVIQACPCPHIVLKPLKDSYKTINLLNMQPGSKAIWAYRHYADRVNSAIREFGRHPLEVFERFKNTKYRSWQLIGMSEDDERLLNSLNYNDLELADAAALMWYIRNALFFNAGLCQDPRIFLWSYDAFVVDPDAQIRPVTEFIGAKYYPCMTSQVHSKSIGKNPSPSIDDRIKSLCDEMYSRLEEVRAAR